MLFIVLFDDNTIVVILIMIKQCARFRSHHNHLIYLVGTKCEVMNANQSLEPSYASVVGKIRIRINSVYLYTLAVSPSLGGVADNTKETTKTMGVLLLSSSKDEGPGRVWMALLEQHSPSSPVFHKLRRFVDAISPTDPTTGLPLYGNPVATADANQNCFTIICHSFLFPARSFPSLISILLSLRALFTPSIHPNLVTGKNNHQTFQHNVPFQVALSYSELR